MSIFDDIFESAPQTDEFDKEAWAAKKKAERDEVYALADATAEAVCADGGKFRDYLDVQAAFRNYSATNALLIVTTAVSACLTTSSGSMTSRRPLPERERRRRFPMTQGRC